MIYVQTADVGEFEIRQGEILRYLGLGTSHPDVQLKRRIDAVTQEMCTAATCRVCFTFSNLAVLKHTVEFDSFCVESRALSKNLRNCTGAVLFAATIGAEADRIVAKYSKLSPALAVIAQAAGAAVIEGWCDLFCTRLGEKLKKENVFLRPRFSPGYGDFALLHQCDLFRVLEAPKRIGVSLTDSLMMVPSKSVSAVIGLSGENTQCVLSGCESCGMRKKCVYSRG